MIKRRTNIFGLIFVLVLMIAVLTTGALASPGPDAADAEYETKSGTAQGSLEEAFANVIDGGTIKLLKDVEVTGELNISSDTEKTITLLGEGYTITNYGTINLKNSVTLNLGEDDYEKTLTVKRTLDNTTPLICLMDNSVLNMYDNVTLGPSSSHGNCAGVQLQGHSVYNMYGGLITECVNWNSVSGAVLVREYCSFNMYGGVIDKCSGYEGGAICVSPGRKIGSEDENSPNLNISGGTISNCTDNWLGGGAICYYSSYPAAINISGLTIDGCSAVSEENGYGGAIFIYSTSDETSINITDTEIKNCTANYGGGICLYEGNLVIADDVKIHNNTAAEAGDDLYFNDSVPEFYDPPSGLILNSTNMEIEGWHIDGLKDGEETLRWTLGDEDTEAYIMPIAAENVDISTALKAAHGIAVSYDIDVSVNDPDYGSASADLTTATSGTEITLTATPNEGYEFVEWQIVTGDVQIENNKFVMPKENVEIVAVFAPTPPPYIPPDIPPYIPPAEPDEPDEPEYTPDGLNTTDHFSYIIGYDDGTVKPDAYITRAEVATIFFRLLTDEARDEFWSESNDYTDVASADWFNNAVSTLSNMGILGGYEDGTFRPNATITRAEFAKIAVSFFDHEDIAAENVFVDVADGSWYENYVAVAAEIGLIEGYAGDVFRPDANITRAEACTIINRTLGRAPDKDHLLPVTEMNTWVDNADTDVWYYAQIQEATNSHDYRWSGSTERWTAKLPEPDWDKLQD